MRVGTSDRTIAPPAPPVGARGAARRAVGSAARPRQARLLQSLQPGSVPVLAGTMATGLLVIAHADNLARQGTSTGRPLFWIGYLLIVLPVAAAFLLINQTRRAQTAGLILLALALYAVKLMHSPLGFTFHDELGHWRTADDILRSHHLYAPNPILRASPFYPGLEIVTSALAQVSGLSLFAAGSIVIGVARVLGVVALYRMYTLALRSHRTAALATLVYMASPTFLFFDGQFSYESLAAALVPVVIVALARLPGRLGIPVAVLIGACVVVTHHLTSYSLCVLLVLWALLAWMLPRRAGEARALAVTATALAGLLVAVAWAHEVATVTTGYIVPVLRNAAGALTSLAHGSGTAKHPFQGTSGYGRPLWEEDASLASVGIILLAIPAGLWLARRRRLAGALPWSLIVIGALYPIALLPRLTQAGTEVSNRASGFVFLGLGVLVALVLSALVPAGTGRLRQTVGRPAGTLAALTCLGVLLVGGVDIGWPPSALQPGPYLPAASSRSIDVRSVWAAQWAGHHLRSRSRLFGDLDLALLMAAYGHQDPQGGFISGVPVPRLFISPRWSPTDRSIVVGDQLRYLAVDRRLSTALPGDGYYFAPSEPGAFHHAQPIPASALAKFDSVPSLDKLFTDGQISIFDTSRVRRASAR